MYKLYGKIFSPARKFCGNIRPITYPNGEVMTNNSELSWRDQVREQLNNRRASLKIEDIAKAINVSEAWLRMFARGKIPNPGVNTVEALCKFLTNYNKKG